jgi:hypothetical protein
MMSQSVEQSSRRRGIRQGAKLTLAGFVLIPAGYGLCFLFDSGVPVVIPLTLFLMGLAWMFYYRIFGESTLPDAKQIQPSFMDAPSRELALHAAENSLPFITQSSRPTTTSEMAHPSSVVEHTTRLLDND